MAKRNKQSTLFDFLKTKNQNFILESGKYVFYYVFIYLEKKLMSRSNLISILIQYCFIIIYS